MDFLPTDYEVPSSSDRYMKLQKGENRFRILESPILGYEWWVEEGEKRLPKRIPMNQTIPVSEIEDPESIKHFWAMVVYNYATKKVQILELTQKGVQKTLRSLAKDEDWGSPVQKYDIVITRTGDGMETRYEVLPKPSTKMDEGIIEMYKNMNINVNALFDGKDPYSATETVDVDEVASGIEKARKVAEGLK